MQRIYVFHLVFEHFYHFWLYKRYSIAFLAWAYPAPPKKICTYYSTSTLKWQHIVLNYLYFDQMHCWEATGLCKGTELLAADGQSVIEAPFEKCPHSWWANRIIHFSSILYHHEIWHDLFYRCGIRFDMYFYILFMHILITILCVLLLIGYHPFSP